MLPKLVGSRHWWENCECERELGVLAKEFIVALTSSAVIIVTEDYGPDRFDRSVADLSADGVDVALAALDAGYLRAWPHDVDGNSLSETPD